MGVFSLTLGGAKRNGGGVREGGLGGTVGSPSKTDLFSLLFK